MGRPKKNKPTVYKRVDTNINDAEIDCAINLLERALEVKNCVSHSISIRHSFLGGAIESVSSWEEKHRSKYNNTINKSIAALKNLKEERHKPIVEPTEIWNINSAAI